MIARFVSRRQFIFRLFSSSVIGAMALNAHADSAYEPTSEDRWPRNLVRAVQVRLKSLGFDPGPIDGIDGLKTRGAIMEFQKSRDLSVDGKISKRLIKDLDLG